MPRSKIGRVALIALLAVAGAVFLYFDVLPLVFFILGVLGGA